MPRKYAAAMAAAVAIALGLASCDDAGPEDADDPAGAVSATATGSPSAGVSASGVGSATPAPTPTIPAPPQGNDTRPNQRAFARYVADAWTYAINRNDVEPLLALSPGKRPCDGCTQLRRELEQRAADGWHVEFPGMQVSAIRLDRAGRDTVARMAVAIPESNAYNDDGTFRSTSPAHAKATFDVAMRHTGNAFRLLSFTITTQ